MKLTNLIYVRKVCPRQTSILATFLLIFIGAEAQLTLPPAISQGVDIFKLGDSISIFEHGLVKIQGGEHELNGKKSYSYGFSPQPGKQLIIGDVQFNSLLVIFNNEKKLTLFAFVKFFSDNGKFESPKKAKAYYKKLKEHIETTWHQPGEAKTYYKKDKFSHTGYEWRSGNTLVKLDMQSSGKGSGSIGLSFETFEIP